MGLGSIGAVGYLVAGGRKRGLASEVVTGHSSRIRSDRPLLDAVEGWIQGPAGDLFLREIGCRGEKVLFLHGLGGSCDHWFELQQILGASCHTASYDLRGHGRSDKANDSTYTADRFASDLEAVLDALGWSKCRLIAHDLGGVSALEFAIRRAKRVTELVWIDPPAGFDEVLPTQQEKLAEAVRVDPHREVFLQFQPLLTGTPSEVRRRILSDLENTAPDALAESLATMISYSMGPGFERLENRGRCLLTAWFAATRSGEALGYGLPFFRIPDTGPCSSWMEML